MAALAAIDDGITDFTGLFDHCLAHTDLATAAAELGRHPEDHLFAVLENSDRVRVFDDDTIVRLDRLVDGLCLTHRLSPDEIATGSVVATPDLIAIDLDGADMELATGGAVALEYDFDGDRPHLDESGSFVGPPGWLDGFSAGDLVAFRRAGHTLEMSVVIDLDQGVDEIRLLTHAFAALTDDETGEACEPVELVEHILFDQPDCFRRPLPPLGELLVAAGLEIDGSWVGRAGTEWSAPGPRLLGELIQSVAETNQLEPCCVAELERVLSAWADPGSADSSTLKALGHGAVADAFAEVIETLLGIDVPTVAVLAERLIAIGRSHAAPAHYLLALHLEAKADTLAAEAELERAVRADGTYGPALARLAWYLSDRGDARRAVALLRRAGFGEKDPMLAFLSGLDSAMPSAGRNEPCPCGSGRKFKACHLDNPTPPVPHRINWLLSKLTYHLTTPGHQEVLIELAETAAGGPEAKGLRRFLDDAFLMELAVFEGGGVTRFLDERAVLLPPDEVDVLDLWSLARLGLWEVEKTDGVSATILRDTRSGDTVEVTDRSTTHRFAPGDLLLARPLPAWGRTWMSGAAIPIDLRLRASALGLLDSDPDAFEIAGWYGGLYDPPTITTREGEPFVVVESELRPIASWEVLEAALDERYEPSEEDSWVDKHALTERETILRATLARRDDILVVSTNAIARVDRVVDRLADVAVEVDRRVKPIAEVMAEAGDLPPPEPMPIPPDMAEAIIEQQEEIWLSEHIPALGGLTPPEAAADPTRREDLLALLRQFEHLGSTGLTMDAERLRRRLGL